MYVQMIPSFCAYDIGLISPHRKEILLGDAARRSLGTASEGRRNIKVLADGMEFSRQTAAEMTKGRAKEGRFRYKYASPQGEGREMIQDLPPDARYEF